MIKCAFPKQVFTIDFCALFKQKLDHAIIIILDNYFQRIITMQHLINIHTLIQDYFC